VEHTDNTGATIYTVNVALKTFKLTGPLSVYICLHVIQAGDITNYTMIVNNSKHSHKNIYSYVYTCAYHAERLISS